MNKSRVLILVDIQNTFYGLQGVSERYKDAKVDCKKLKEFLLELTGNLPEHEEVDLFGYLAHAPTQRGMSFFALLKKLGYTLKIKSFVPGQKKLSVVSDMQMDLIDKASQYDQVMVVSGSGAFYPAFRAIKDNWDVETQIVSFEHVLHGVYLAERAQDTRYVDQVDFIDPRDVVMD